MGGYVRERRPAPRRYSFGRCPQAPQAVVLLPAFMSVGHEHGERDMIKQVAGCATENQLPHAALCVSSLDQQVGPKRLGIDQNDLTGRATLRLNVKGLSGNPVNPQGARNSLSGRARHSSADDGQNDNTLGLEKKRHREGDRPRRLGAPVPGDHNRLAHLLGSDGRSNQNRPATLKQGFLQTGHARTVAVRSGAANDNDVERATVIAEERRILERIPEPAERQPVRLPNSFWYGTRTHEGLELLMSALNHLLRWNLGRKRYSERHLDSDEVVKTWTAGEAFDVAFEASAEDKSRF